jgi:hypothetical protein
MARPSKQERITQAVRAYLTQAEQQSPETHPLDVGSVAQAVGCVRSSIYNYGLQRDILDAAARQRECHQTDPDSHLKALLRQLQGELAAMAVRNHALLERLNLVEANAVRLGVDPDDLYRPLLKPPRQVPNLSRRRKNPPI